MAVDQLVLYGPRRDAAVTTVERTTVTAASSYTSVSWASGAYREVLVEFDGILAGGGYLAFRANNDSGATKYADMGTTTTHSAVSVDSSHETLGYARVAVTGGAWPVHCTIRFFPLTTGNNRSGFADSANVLIGNSAGNFARHTAFQYLDTSTAVTSITLLPSTSTFTGSITVTGIGV